jgi:hypothetical protein
MVTVLLVNVAVDAVMSTEGETSEFRNLSGFFCPWKLCRHGRIVLISVTQPSVPVFLSDSLVPFSGQASKSQVGPDGATTNLGGSLPLTGTSLAPYRLSPPPPYSSPNRSLVSEPGTSDMFSQHLFLISKCKPGKRHTDPVRESSVFSSSLCSSRALCLPLSGRSLWSCSWVVAKELATERRRSRVQPSSGSPQLPVGFSKGIVV